MSTVKWQTTESYFSEKLYTKEREKEIFQITEVRNKSK